MNDELHCLLALTRLPGLGLRGASLLYQQAGSAAALFRYKDRLEQLIPDISPRAVTAFASADEALRRAEAELTFADAHHIRCLTPDSPEWPVRLHHCDDAPLVLFYRGTADLNARHILCVVGTRRCTDYGKALCREFLTELQRAVPRLLVVSGLAYGIDIHAHRAALGCGLPTVGVLAHGLDRLYPAMHRQTACDMLAQGGLLTEFMSGTVPDKGNFVRRNRIVAGMSDACLVVESADKGGALITAGIAQSYGRDVFAVPGRVGDPSSAGCNTLIRKSVAGLVECGMDVAEAMGWATAAQPVQRELFPDLSPVEERVVRALGGSDGKSVNQLVVETDLPVQELLSQLFELEMRGIVRSLSGGLYRV